MGISDDIKPKRVYRPVNHFNYLPEQEFLPEEESAHRVQRETPPEKDFSEREELEDEFFNSKKGKKNSGHNEIHIEQEEKAKKNSRFSKIIIWLMVLGLIGLVAWQNTSTIKSFINQKILKQTEQVESPIEAKKTEEFYPGEIMEDSDKEEAAKEEPQAETAKEEINKGTISIEILNGNGLQGSAEKVKTELETQGFKISKVANAKNFNYKTTLIYFKTGKDKEANLVKEAIVGKEISLENNDTLVGQYEVVIVLGAK